MHIWGRKVPPHRGSNSGRQISGPTELLRPLYNAVSVALFFTERKQFKQARTSK